MIRRPGLARKGLIIVILILVSELSFVGLIAFEIIKTRARLVQEQHSLSVIETSSRIANRTQRLATYLSIRASDMEGLTSVDTGQDLLRRQIPEDLAQLAKLSVNDPEAGALLTEQHNFLRAMEDLYKKDMAFDRNRIVARTVGITADSLTFQKNLLEKYEALAAEYKKKRATDSGDTAEEINRIKSSVLVGALLNFFGGLLITGLFIMRVLGRILKISRDIDEETVSSTRDTDELGQIESAFAQMLGDVAEANTNEEMLISGASDVICSLGPRGRIESINDACLLQWGRSKISLMGTNISGIFARQNDADERAIEGFMTALRANAGDQGPLPSTGVDIRLLHKSEAIIDTHWTFYFSDDERSQSVFCFVQNIGEAKKREAQLRLARDQVSALLKNLPVGIMVVDSAGTVASFNKKIVELVDPQLLARGQGQVSIDQVIEIGGLDRSGILEQAAKQPGMRAFTRAAGGERVPTDISVQYLERRGKDNTAAANCIVIVEDVRERLRVENIRRDFVDLLRERLGAPLYSVRNDMVAVVDAKLPTGESNLIKIRRVISNADRLLQLIESLIKVETLKPGKLVGELQTTDLGAVLEASINSLREYAQAQGVTIEEGRDGKTAIEPGVFTIMADRERLIQVVVNLLSNAIKFSPSGSAVRLWCALEPRAGVAGQIIVSIADSGRGVPQDQQKSIFEPYHQALSADKQAGTGLGLAICKSIIEGHGGSIGVESGIGVVGSRFWFSLPVKTGSAAGDKGPAGDISPESPENPKNPENPGGISR